MDLSIVIVSYNTQELLKNCLSSIFNYDQGIDYEVWVVDNQSKDGSAEMVEREFPQVKLVINPINGGFSQANNLALSKIKSRYSLLLNPDTIVPQGTLKECVNYMDAHKDIGCLGCKVVKPDGSLDRACKRGFPTPWNSLCYFLKLDKIFKNPEKYGGYNATHIDEDQESDIDCLVGAFMLMRKETLAEVGLLDDTFFMYGEDIDLCYRIKNAGWRNYYYPKVEIIHYKGESSKKQSTRMIGEFHKSMIIFYDKHYKNKYNGLTRLLSHTGIYLKWGLSLFKNIFRKEKKVN